MFENDSICPYTGLRSFSEDESLYFKGREEDIDQATSQLQKNKFLMLTGASGDGKSSLVFAGIIPNARAGFLKSKYSSWCVASFRPERTPFKNLSEALATQLGINNPYTVQGELNHGFSALVDLYKNSKRYVDTHSAAWIQADDKGKAAIKREGANLIILVDQFEEFFTNPENYQNGAPSRDANLVLNLLLETARIALDEDIPIYVIFTMRSDYIGQCAAFRGLPEYIGFSQFFVPRLNRSQLQQVIEEPATLSGNRIARRLTERLIHDLTEGVDQLPILQHALKQIWIAADNGHEEMDLQHYARVGGMSVTELPEEQTEKFNQWFSELPESIRACYHAPGLQNVLDTHTNKLYAEAAGYYQQKSANTISEADAKRIVRTAFTCLTKIDQGRAVRNRMTLQEITNILGDESFDYIKVGGLLNIFREPDNTFIIPFISEENPESRQPDKDAVLDITHESLIRNWQYLGQWAKEEFDSHAVSLDFEKQLDRWVSSNRSKNFLLSIGPLTYFENWYNKAKPNAWWIARYLPEETNKEERLKHAQGILNNSNEFIDRSARRHVITRTIMRYGPKKIALVLGILALIIFSSFSVRSYFKKQNNFVLSSLHDESLQLAASPKVDRGSKSLLIAEQLEMGTTTIDEQLSVIKDTAIKIKTMNALASLLVYQGRTEPKTEIARSLFVTDSLLENYPVTFNQISQVTDVLREMNLFRVVLEIAYLYHPDGVIRNYIERNAKRSARWVQKILEIQPPAFQDIKDFNLALEHAVNHNAFTKQELQQILSVLSPFEGGLQTDWLKNNFQAGKIQLRGSEALAYGFKHNGLYQQLAYLYAATEQTTKTLQCVDTLLANSENNFQGDYALGADNATNIAVVYFANGFMDSLDAFVKGYCAKKRITTVEFYERMIGRTLRDLETSNNIRIYDFMDETRNIQIKFASRKQLALYFDKYRQAVQSTIKDINEKNWLLAISYKNQGILTSALRDSIKSGSPGAKDYFDKAMSIYRTVSPAYLQTFISLGENSSDVKLISRKYLFVYPDVRLSFHPGEPRLFTFFIFGDSFLDYIVKNNLLETFYPGPDEMVYLGEWIRNYQMTSVNRTAFFQYKSDYNLLKNLAAFVSKQDISKTNQMNWLYLQLGKEAQDSGKMAEMLGFYDQVDRASVFSLLRNENFFGLLRDHTFRMIGFAMEGYIKAGKPGKAIALASLFKNPSNRSSLYAFTAVELLKEKFDAVKVQTLLDSSFAEMDRKENRMNFQPDRGMLAYAITMQNPDQLAKAYSLIRNVPFKTDVMMQMVRALGFNQHLYEAEMNIPDMTSASDQSQFIWSLLQGYKEGIGEKNPAWLNFDNGYPAMSLDFIKYVDENN